MAKQPYKPSWVDRLTASIDKLRISPWLFYIIVSIPLLAIFIGVQAWQGAYQTRGFFWGHIFVAVQPIYGIAMMHYSDWMAAKAFKKFQPAMKGDDQDISIALYRLTTLPSRPAWVAGFLGGVFAVFQLLSLPDVETLAAFQQVAATPISLVVHNVNIIAAWTGYGVWIYQALYKLKTINWLVTSQAVIDPFHPEPLYALSGIASRITLIVMPPLYGWYLVMTSGTLDKIPPLPAIALIYSFSIIFGLIAFVWPLWGAHQELVEAKTKALEDNAAHYKIAVRELHKTVSVKALDQIEIWHEGIDALDIERRFLDRLPTWPWPPGTFRTLFFALIIPVIVWILQNGLQQLME